MRQNLIQPILASDGCDQGAWPTVAARTGELLLTGQLLGQPPSAGTHEPRKQWNHARFSPAMTLQIVKLRLGRACGAGAVTQARMNPSRASPRGQNTVWVVSPTHEIAWISGGSGSRGCPVRLAPSGQEPFRRLLYPILGRHGPGIAATWCAAPCPATHRRAADRGATQLA